MASGFRLAFFLCLTGGLLISETSSSYTGYSRGCPLGWTLCGSRCFIVQTRRLTMADAELSCVRLGGNLASIRSVFENTFIRGLIHRRCGSYASAWIGLFDAIQEGKWLWTDGSNTGLRCWAHGEPNDLYSREHCVEMNFGGTAYWGDRPCSWFRPYVCARTVSLHKPLPSSGLLGSSRTVYRQRRNVSL